MDISQLRTLIHVAELGSLSKAADRLHIAQPALSRQIRLLEAELGVRLFQRHGRGMTVTEQGQDVLQHASRIMAELEEIRAVVADENAPLRGHVSIGMPPTASDILSEPLVAAFRDAHPEATLRIVSAYSGYLLDWLHRGELDAAILYDPKSARTLHIQPLLEETLFLIGPREPACRPTRVSTSLSLNMSGCFCRAADMGYVQSSSAALRSAVFCSTLKLRPTTSPL
ncbi:LysR family transcriptional regulator [Bosea vestrisii]|nr:LysR family transcriptional regulator [Bosea vestrisii]WID95182.1 LysR family transcriptional regulator [Bosea vestrisii]